jgi:hypothetical protein
MRSIPMPTFRIRSVAQLEVGMKIHVPHFALGQLILTLLATLTGLCKAWKLQKQTKPNQAKPKSSHKSKKLSKSGSEQSF